MENFKEEDTPANVHKQKSATIRYPDIGLCRNGADELNS